MKCNKHPDDETSTTAICASCLRQRLLSLIEEEHLHLSYAYHPHPPFPRSVSPYISPRKSNIHHRDNTDNFHSLPDHKFFSTPQIGPTAEINVDDNSKHLKKKRNKFWLFRNLFRSKSEIIITNTDPKSSESTVESKSWFSRPKKLRTYSLDDSTISDHCNTEELKETPRRTPGRGGGGRRRHLSRNVSEIVFCLSPLVRASPNRAWNQKGGLPAEVGVSGEGKVPVNVKHCRSVYASSFCKNRSKKLADFGRRNR